jgi:hypothetical protein
MQTQFCWTSSEKPTTFVKLVYAFPDNFSMKNRKLKNLDVLYLKNYKSYVANFWVCRVLCLA